MNKYIFIAACAAVAGIMAGCSKENIEPETSQEMTGSEVQKPGNDGAVLTPHQVIKASSTATKTSLDGLQILWSKGDQLSLFNADGQTCTYTLTGDGGQTSGDFQTETMPEEGYRYAIYPAVPEATVSEGVISTSIPEAQTYNGSDFPVSYPMAAVSSDGEKYSFVNLATVLDLSLVGDAAVKTISIEAAGGEKLAGAATVDFNGETPVMTATESASVTLTCTEPVQLTASATEFRFIVAPGTYSKGFKITVTDGAGKTTVITTAEAESVLTAGSVKNFGGTMGVYASDFENIYIIGDGTFYEPWNTKIMVENPAGSEWTSAFTKGENGIYTWTGVLAPGTFKFPWNADIIQNFFGVEGDKLIYYPEQISGYDPKLTIGTPGKYEITINVNKLTFDIRTVEEYPVPENLYLFGDGTGAGWLIDHGEKMVKRPDLKFENNADGEGVFYMVTRLGAVEDDSGFKFLETHTGKDFNVGYQFAWGLSKIWKNGSDRKYNRVKENGMYSIKVDTKYWNYEVLKMTGENPAEIYIYGDATGYGWDLGKTAADETQKLASSDGITYSWTGDLVPGEFKFAFGGMYLSPEGAPALSFDNGFLVTGNDADGWKIVVRTDNLNDTKYQVAEDGNYTVTINTDTMDLTVQKN